MPEGRRRTPAGRQAGPEGPVGPEGAQGHVGHIGGAQERVREGTRHSRAGPAVGLPPPTLPAGESGEEGGCASLTTVLDDPVHGYDRLAWKRVKSVHAAPEPPSAPVGPRPNRGPRPPLATRPPTSHDGRGPGAVPPSRGAPSAPYPAPTSPRRVPDTTVDGRWTLAAGARILTPVPPDGPPPPGHLHA